MVFCEYMKTLEAVLFFRDEGRMIVIIWPGQTIVGQSKNHVHYPESVTFSLWHYNLQEILSVNP